MILHLCGCDRQAEAELRNTCSGPRKAERLKYEQICLHRYGEQVADLETELRDTLGRLVRAEKDVEHWTSLHRQLVNDKIR